MYKHGDQVSSIQFQFKYSIDKLTSYYNLHKQFKYSIDKLASSCNLCFLGRESDWVVPGCFAKTLSRVIVQFTARQNLPPLALCS